jgi:hypothetical protein
MLEEALSIMEEREDEQSEEDEETLRKADD